MYGTRPGMNNGSASEADGAVLYSVPFIVCHRAEALDRLIQPCGHHADTRLGQPGDARRRRRLLHPEWRSTAALSKSLPNGGPLGPDPRDAE